MASDSFFQEPAVVAGATAVGTALLAWLGQRLVGKAAIQTAVNQGFRELMDQLRQELREALNERDEARDLAHERQARIEELQRTIFALETQVAAGLLLQTVAHTDPVILG